MYTDIHTCNVIRDYTTLHLFSRYCCHAGLAGAAAIIYLHMYVCIYIYIYI